MPVTPETLYEQTLVVRCQIGDEPAFQELLRLYGPRLAGEPRMDTKGHESEGGGFCAACCATER